ncbi:uncharacterized protein LOC107883680 [Acyrthosiphon pisum]|uniref:Integrase catalytic domain-containing protein n=1 Tax=Acyrthosiphon pisum TaxID=7029 RepID=A0A8R2H4J3_ACYPI|nr:uncharacterized protein LOC107883680 [Acyrthosiphon pisum]|eukprot:XP_016659690.1 PREDICTED: uncharacterized protein LOC107883680 [Acyrthosiphon pisum]
MSTNDRRNFVMKSRLCFNCLNFGHQVSSCYFPTCPRCGERHNSKLHEEQANTSNQDASIANDVERPEPHATAMYTEISAQEAENLNVILATAIVNVCDTFGRMHSCRAVLDSGSQLNFITNSCAKRLNLSTALHTLNIVGVSAMASTAKQLQDTIMTSRFGDFKTTIKFYSLQTIVSALPSQVLIRDNLKMPHNIHNQLADPNFHSPGPIDVLLGADIFFDVLYGEKFPLSNLACLHRTKLGWIWLKKERSCWPDTPILPSEIPEIRKVKLILATTNKEPFWLLKKYSTWSKLLRTTALVQRFVSNCKAKQLNHERSNGFISVDEMNKARSFWLMQAQSESMSNEIADLRSGKMVHRGSCLKALNPFIDDQGLVRVGGRLAYAPGQYNTRHPIVLPSKSLITKLIFNYEHIRLMHAGPQALLAHVTLNYWPIRGRQIATQIVQKCVTCFRARPQFTPPLMAPLPSVRVTIARPFANSGVDLCGPIFVRSGLRKISPTKSYICVFICMVTRAIHLELVSSLSTEDFLAALSRFMSRRGQCMDLHSDNGTNFVGADRTLKTYFKATVNSNKVHDFLTMGETTWHFITPASPHFRGLWESAVKSAKKHLLRVSKGVLLTFDETRTLLCQIEAALNSRPLSPLSLDPNDFNALTPGHFLIGGPLMLPPEPDVSSIPQNRLKRYSLMRQQMQLFRKRWSQEYLPQLHRRGKWTKPNRNFCVGDLAVLRDDNMPPLKWPLVRVAAVHPGADGVVRAVTVRNSTGSEFRRPAIKLSLLPIEKDHDDED